MAADDRIDADDQQGNEDEHSEPLLNAGGPGDAAMLDREDDQHQDAADQECGVDIGRGEEGYAEADQRPVADHGRQRRYAVGCENRLDGILRRGAGMGRDILGDTGAIGGDGGGMGADPVEHRLRVRRRNREEGIEDIARGDHAAEREHRRPGEPVAPDGKRRDEFRIAQPCGRSIDRGAAGLVGEHPGDFRIGEGLQEAHDHRNDPDREGQLAGRAGNAADGEEHERRHASCHPESALPVERAYKLPLGAGSNAGVHHICHR